MKSNRKTIIRNIKSENLSSLLDEFDITIKYVIKYSTLEFFKSYICFVMKTTKISKLLENVVKYCCLYNKNDFASYLFELIMQEEDVTDSINRSFRNDLKMSVLTNVYLDINNGEHRMSMFAENLRQLLNNINTFQNKIQTPITSSRFYKMKLKLEDMININKVLSLGNVHIAQLVYDLSKKFCVSDLIFEEKIYRNVECTKFLLDNFTRRGSNFFINVLLKAVNKRGYEESIKVLIEYYLKRGEIDFYVLYETEDKNLIKLNKFFINFFIDEETNKNINKEDFFEYCMLIGDISSIEKIMNDVDILQKFTYLNEMTNIDCLSMLESHDNFYDFLEINKELLLDSNKEIIKFVESRVDITYDKEYLKLAFEQKNVKTIRRIYENMEDINEYLDSENFISQNIEFCKQLVKIMIDNRETFQTLVYCVIVVFYRNVNVDMDFIEELIKEICSYEFKEEDIMETFYEIIYEKIENANAKHYVTVKDLLLKHLLENSHKNYSNLLKETVLVGNDIKGCEIVFNFSGSMLTQLSDDRCIEEIEEETLRYVQQLNLENFDDFLNNCNIQL